MKRGSLRTRFGPTRPSSPPFSDQSPLPFDPATVAPEPGEIDRLQSICGRLSPVFRRERIIAREACFRPVTQDGLPLIDKVLQKALTW